MVQFYSYWKIIAWRLLRGAFHTALAETLIVACGTAQFNVLQCFPHVYQNWNNPKTFAIMLSVAFVSGFLQALGMAIRDTFSRGNKASVYNKLPF